MEATFAEETKVGYKLTEFGWIPEDWEVKQLGEIGEFKNGINKSKEDFGHGVPFINLLDVFGKPTINHQDFGLVNANEKEVKQFNLLKGDVLFIRSSVKPEGVGLTSLVDIDLNNTVYSGFIIRFRCKEKYIDHTYKKYCFYEKNFRQYLVAKSSISANTNINQDSLKKLFIALPTISEQHAIAKLLSTWDKNIEILQQLISAKQKNKKALAQQLLTGKKRFEGFTDSWKEVKLGEIFKERVETNRPDLKLLSITGSGGIINRDSVERRDTSNEDKSKYRRITYGDIGYNTMRLWQGVAALSNLEGIISPAYTVITPMDGIDGKFMDYLFKLPEMIHLFYRHSQGLVDDTRNCKFPHFAQIKVNIPGFSEQTKIASILQAADKEVELLKQKLEALRLQKKGLMQQLLTGKKRLK